MRDLGENLHNESGVIRQIAFPEPGLFYRAMQPLQAGRLDPVRCIFFHPAVYIKRITHRTDNLTVQPVTNLIHKIELLRCADSDPEDVRFGTVHHLHHLGLLLFGQRPERRAVNTRDLNVRMPVLQNSLKFFNNTRCGPIEKMTPPFVGPIGTYIAQEIGTVDAIDIPISEQLAQPNQRHAVGRIQHRLVQDALQLLIPARLHNARDAHGGGHGRQFRPET